MCLTDLTFITYCLLSNGKVKFYDSKTQQIHIADKLPSRDEYQRQFKMFKGYDTTDEEVKRYANDFIQWSNELKTISNGKMNYLKYYSHNSAVELLFKFFRSLDFDKTNRHHINSMDDITDEEYEFLHGCHGSGISYLLSEGLHECFGYDYQKFYPRIMASNDLFIPISKGNVKIIDKLPTSKNLKYGIYRVKIVSDNADFQKMFAFTKRNYYTSICLKRCLKYAKKYDISIELINDGKANVCFYDNVVSGDKIFGEWLNTFYQYSLKYPKNKLIKHVMSSLHGELSSYSTISRTYEQIEEQGLKVGMTNKCDYIIKNHVVNDESEYYVLMSRDCSKRMKYNFRLSPFLQSYGRNKIADFMKPNIKHVVRVCCDGVIFNKQIDTDELIIEDKTTGKIDFCHVNCFKNFTNDYSSLGYENYKLNHK